MKKLIALLLALTMVLSLAACGGNAAPETEAPKTPDAPSADATQPETPVADEFELAPIKVGVLVADVSGEEALAFRAYYEEYLAPHYNVTLTYIFKDTDTEAFLHKLSESFSARLKAEECEKRISPVEIEKNL